MSDDSPRQRFLAAARKAQRIELEAEVSFAGLRALADRRADLRRNAQELQAEIQRQRQDPASHGNRAQRTQMRVQVDELARQLEELQQAQEVADELLAELRPSSAALAKQRDAVGPVIDRARRECETLLQAGSREILREERQAQAAAGATRYPTPSVGG